MRNPHVDPTTIVKAVLCKNGARSRVNPTLNDVDAVRADALKSQPNAVQGFGAKLVHGVVVNERCDRPWEAYCDLRNRIYH